MTKSVKHKLSALLSALVLFTLTVVSIVNYYHFHQESIQKTSETLSDDAILVGKALEQRMSKIFDVLHVTAKNLNMNHVTDAHHPPLLHQLVNVKEQLQSINAYYSLIDGTTYSTSTNGLVPNFNAKEKQREWYTRALNREKNILTKPYVSAEGDAVMAASVPIIRKAEVIGVLSVNLSIGSITEFVSSLSTKNQVFISNKDGYIIASPYLEHLGQNIYALKPTYKQYQQELSSLHTSSYDGKSHYVSSSLISSFGWNVWAWEDWKVINSPSLESVLLNILILAITLPVFLIFTYQVVSNIVYKPIGGEPEVIANLVNQVSNGSLINREKLSHSSSGILKSVQTMVLSLRRIVLQINKSKDEFDNFSRNLNKSSLLVKKSAESQLLQIDQTSTSMNEMTTTVKEVAKTAQEAASIVTNINELTVSGTHIISIVGDGIDELVNDSKSVQQATLDLSKATNDIEHILEVIVDIADQTNLLALNAAIEAARAGEQGRGFAVVADEVRNLANRTEQSTNEIQSLITNLQAEAQRSVELIEKNTKNAKSAAMNTEHAIEVISDIKNSMNDIRDLNNQIATATEEQSVVANEINMNVLEINELAKETVSCSENNIRESKALLTTATTLSESVESFKL